MYPSYTSLVSISYMIVYMLFVSHLAGGPLQHIHAWTRSPPFVWLSIWYILVLCVLSITSVKGDNTNQYLILLRDHWPTELSSLCSYIHTCIIVYIMCIGHLYIMYIFSNLTRSLFVDNYSVNWPM